MTGPHRNPRSYDVGRFNLEHETQRLRIQAELTWPKEARHLAWYGLRDGMSENAFDFAIARFLYQHLPDPVAAARETLRLLKPGGKFVLVDVDDHLWGIADPPRPTDAALVERGIAAQAAQGGDRLVGRKLLRILRAAGFEDRELDLVVYSSDLAGDRFREVLRDLVNDDLRIEVEDGVMTQDEAEDVRASDERWIAGEHPLMLEIVMMACGVKPAT
jgi:SAM-dependent methyltransferase